MPHGSTDLMPPTFLVVILGSVPAENLNFLLNQEGHGSGLVRSGPAGLTS